MNIKGNFTSKPFYFDNMKFEKIIKTISSRLILLIIPIFSVYGNAQEIDNSIEVKYPLENPKTSFELLAKSWQIDTINFFNKNFEKELKSYHLNFKNWIISEHKLELWDIVQKKRQSVYYVTSINPITSDLTILLDKSSTNLDLKIMEINENYLRLYSDYFDVEIKLTNKINN